MSLVHIVSEARRLAGISQRQLAERAGTSQPAVARIEQGHGSPTIATVQRLLAAAGFELRVELVPAAPADPVIEAFKRDVDRTLLRGNLRRSIDERLRALEEYDAFARELQRGARRAARVAEPDPKQRTGARKRRR